MEKETILITGGNGNIAQSIIRKYLDEDNIVISVDIADKCLNKEFTTNPNYQYYKADVTKIEELNEIYNKIKEKYQRITHLISAAGCPIGTELNGINEVTIEDIDKSIMLNLTSHIYITKTFLPLIEAEQNKNKTITLISSINALKSFNLPIYSAAKSGIYGFVRAVVKELGQKDIRINAVSPGTVPTPEDIASGTQYYNYRYKSMLALKDFTKPADIADAVYSLTNIMKAVTGQNLVVDSGQIS